MKPATSIRRHKAATMAPEPGRNEILSPLAFWIVAAALAAAVFAIYLPALNFEFILDDHRFLGDPRIQSSGHIWEYFTSYVWSQIAGGPPSFYRPLFVLWMRVNFMLSEMSSWGWHLLSVAKHVSVAVLLGILVWKLLKDRIAALIASVLFALHPAQVESVAWVTVPDPLMSAGVLGSLILYLVYSRRAHAECPPDAERQHRKAREANRHRSSDSSRLLWLIASATACLAALMAKETAIVVPGIIFVLALLLPLKRSEENHTYGIASAVRVTIPFLSVAVIYLLLRLNALGRISPPTQHLPWSTVVLSWPATLWFYIKVMLWPAHSWAFADPNLAEGFTLRGVVFPALGVGCALALLIWVCGGVQRVAQRLPAPDARGVMQAIVLGALLLILPILPALNLNALNPGDFLHGRYTYLPLSGLMLIAATGWHMLKKGRTILLGAAGLIAVGFAVLTVQQEGMWRDDLTDFTVAHQIAPHNEPVALNLTRAHVQVALRLDDDGRCDEAMPIFDQATRQYPQEWYAWAGRGECMVKLNDLRGAEQSLRRAAEISHEPRIAEQWQQVRAMMGLPPASLP